MGGGDLNTKKSWHPKTMKNQEQVWKAERAASEERKRINELRNEYAQERDRSELNQLAKQRNGEGPSTNEQLSWMYDKYDKKANHEDYLLGKAVDSKFETSEKKEPEAMRAVTQRVVGSSMMNASGDSQVDLARKLREDPLILVKERERAARAALLNNPLQRKKIAELLRKEQEKNNEKKSKKSKKNDLDGVLASKLSALKGGSNIDLAALLASDDSSSDSDDSHKKKKKKKKKSKDKSKDKKSKKKSKRHEADSDADDIRENDHKAKKRSRDSKIQLSKERDKPIDDDEPKRKHKRDSSPDPKQRDKQYNKQRTRSNERQQTPEYRSNVDRNKYKNYNDDKNYRNHSSSHQSKHSRANSNERRTNSRDNRDSRKYHDSKKQGLSDKEKAARLAEMAKAGHEHEKERSDRVAKQREDIANEEKQATGRRRAIDSNTLPTSLESRIHSNRHHIQKNERHMNEHFARR